MEYVHIQALPNNRRNGEDLSCKPTDRIYSQDMKTNETTTEYSTEFLQNVTAELRLNKRWDNGAEDLAGTTEISAQLRECFGLKCYTDGRFIVLE